MIPWPIALLALFYGVVATSAAATACKIVFGLLEQSLLWAVVWFGFSAGAVLGLVFLKPWGRKLAIWTSLLLIVTTLAVAALLIAAKQPGWGLVVTLSTACHYLMIRYLQRPRVKAWFGTQQSVTAKGA